jgi:hypothetical protein
VAIGAAKQVLLLRYCALHVGSAGYIWVCHIQYGEALAVFLGKPSGYLAPVAGKYLDCETGVRLR